MNVVIEKKRCVVHSRSFDFKFINIYFIALIFVTILKYVKKKLDVLKRKLIENDFKYEIVKQLSFKNIYNK